jgi:hypothetical protein
MKYDIGKELIAPFWQDVVDRIKDNLVKKGRNSSGMTYQEIENPHITVGDKGYNIKLLMPDYYAYLDEGVRGTGKFGKNPTIRLMRRNTGRFFFKQKQPPISAMREFMRNRGIVGKTRKGSRGTKNSQKQLDSIAFAIAHSIWQTGTQQTDFYSDVVNQKLIDDFAQDVIEELGQEIIINIEL